MDYERNGRKVRVRLRGSVAAASSDAVLHLVKLGAGIAAFPGTADLRSEVAAGHLVRLFPGWKTSRMYLHAVYPGSTALASKTRTKRSGELCGSLVCMEVLPVGASASMRGALFMLLALGSGGAGAVQDGGLTASGKPPGSAAPTR